ncbi:MAG: fatty acid hydroxylase family protein [Burkholderiaceae bacterium]
MELTSTPMQPRQRTYREIYRQRINGWYNGYLHVAMIYSIGALSLWYYTAHLDNVLWWEWLIVPLVFIASNIFEWALHTHVMHRPQNFPGARAIYQRHTLQHHQFFTETEMRFAGEHDWRVTFFPPYALIVFILMSIPGVAVLSWLVSANVGWLFICTTTSMYLIYEFMHFCCHVEENAFVRHMPFVNTLRRHHFAHHNQSIMMERNMNLTFPIADWLFGTSDLNRGLFGHLFNGYNTQYVKTDMREVSRTPSVRTRDSAGKPQAV